MRLRAAVLILVSLFPFFGGPALAASFSQPQFSHQTRNGDIYVTDLSRRLRRIRNGVITTVAGAPCGGR